MAKLTTQSRCFPASCLECQPKHSASLKLGWKNKYLLIDWISDVQCIHPFFAHANILPWSQPDHQWCVWIPLLNCSSWIIFIWWHQGKYKKLSYQACFCVYWRGAVEEAVHYVPVYGDPGNIFRSGSPEHRVWFWSYGYCKSHVWFCLSHVMSLVQLRGLRTYIPGTNITPDSILY